MSSGKQAPTERDWYWVQLSVPWIVKGVDGPQDAINIAVTEVGRRTEDASHNRRLDIDVLEVPCQDCTHSMEAVLLVADMAMVGLRLNAEVRAKDADHSRRVACRVLGEHLEAMPLQPLDVEKSEST